MRPIIGSENRSPLKALYIKNNPSKTIAKPQQRIQGEYQAPQKAQPRSKKRSDKRVPRHN
jgi:hypothetical protein